MIQFAIYPLSLFVRTPIGRLSFVVLGAIIVLGPSEINFAKIFYFVILAVCAFYDFIAILKQSIPEKSRRLLNLTFLTFSLLLSTYIGASFANLSLTTFLRGNIQVIIFLLGIPVVLNCAKRISTERVEFLILLFGLLSAFSVWYYWSQKHGAYSFSTARFALDADYLAFLGYCVALSSIFRNRFYRYIKFLSVILIPVFLFLSLSRTNYVFVLWILFWSILANRLKSKWLFFAPMIFLTFLYSGIFLDFVRKIENNAAIYNRFLKPIIHFNLRSYLYSDSRTDASLVMRHEQGKIAIQIFEKNIIFGQGSLRIGEYIDHFYGAFAILGISGMSIVTLLLIKILNFPIWHYLPTNERRAIAIFFSTLIPATLIYNWTSNKGFWLALLCLIAVQESKNFRNSEYDFQIP